MNINDSLLTDIAFKDGDFVITPGGDIATISGLANLKNALFHRLITVPGSLVHRPTYGIGVKLYQNSLSSFSKQQELADLIQRQFSLDPRIKSVDNVGFEYSDENPQLTKISVFLTPVGYSEQQMIFVPFSGGAGT